MFAFTFALPSGGKAPYGKFLDQVMREWQAFDNERRILAERLGIGNDPEVIRSRADAAKACLDQAQAIILSHYEKVLNPDSKIPWHFVAAVLGAALAAIVFVIFRLFPSVFSFHFASVTSTGNESLSERIAILEHSRNLSSAILASVVLIGLLGIVSNYLLSLWRTKSVSRQVIRRRLAGLNIKLRDTILAQTDSSDAALREQEMQVQRFSNSVDKQVAALSQATQSARAELQHAMQDELFLNMSDSKSLVAELNKRFRKAAKAIA